MGALPVHPELRRIAVEMERCGRASEIYDACWRILFTSEEITRLLGVDHADAVRHYGSSPVVRGLAQPETWGGDENSMLLWWKHIVPVIRHDVGPDDEAFEATFGPLAAGVAHLDPGEPRPMVTVDGLGWSDLTGIRDPWVGRIRHHYIRLHDTAGTFIGTLLLADTSVPDSLAARLTRGNLGVFTMMDQIRQPARRSAAILFADLVESGALSRRLSSLAYFKLIRSLTDLIDGEVVDNRGLPGKHAGDGASALFLPVDGDESGTAQRAIRAGRAIRDRAGDLHPTAAVQVRVGLHWGATLTIGQVSTHGRLEVTAMGDAMTQAARIESAAPDGSVLASKDLIERLSHGDADMLGIDPHDVAYQLLRELARDEKVVRDAGSISVTEI